jgi:hypothetical protein
MSLSTALSALFLATISVVAQTPAPPAADAKPKVWEYAEYKIVPVRVHLLRDTVTPAAGTTLTNADITRIFKKANGIWHVAGVHLRIESVVSEKPAALGEYEHSAELPTPALLPLRPADTRSEGMFHVYYIGAMSPNGIFMRRDGIFVKESARLRKVPGGIDEPLPRVSAHELGHGMGLPHRQDTTNLMASGTTGTSLNDAEIEIVRQTVSRLKWVETPDGCSKEADGLLFAGKKEEAASRYRALLDLTPEPKRRAEIEANLETATGKGGKGHAADATP